MIGKRMTDEYDDVLLRNFFGINISVFQGSRVTFGGVFPIIKNQKMVLRFDRSAAVKKIPDTGFSLFTIAGYRAGFIRRFRRKNSSFCNPRQYHQ
jgi:hypothetical protein